MSFLSYADDHDCSAAVMKDDFTSHGRSHPRYRTSICKQGPYKTPLSRLLFRFRLEEAGHLCHPFDVDLLQCLHSSTTS